MGHAKKADLLKTPTWFRMEALFDGPAKRIQVLENTDVLLRGVKYRGEITCGCCGHTIKTAQLSVKGGIEDKLDLTPELAICTVPPAIMEEQAEFLRITSEAQLRMPVMLLTDNVHYVRLRPISGGLAKKLQEQSLEKLNPSTEGDSTHPGRPQLEVVGDWREDETEPVSPGPEEPSEG